MFDKLTLSPTTSATIAWEMTPDLAFCTFSAKGLSSSLVNTDERVCYFFIDNYGEEPKLYLMERGTRYVNILAEILAPAKILLDCIVNQGSRVSSRDNFAIDSTVRKWLLAEVIEPPNSPYLLPVTNMQKENEDFGEKLPLAEKLCPNNKFSTLPTVQTSLPDDQVNELILRWNFPDTTINPQGFFANALADTGNTLTVIDNQTGILWQRKGFDLCSIRKMTRHVEQLNKEGFSGFHDWRMPTLEEAMSLMESTPNTKGLYLHPCFSKELPFVFTSTKRKPTGYWFADYKQGKVYWSSGTVPGGFCRLCRNTDQ